MQNRVTAFLLQRMKQLRFSTLSHHHRVYVSGKIKQSIKVLHREINLILKFN
jgi:hypothetical protein